MSSRKMNNGSLIPAGKAVLSSEYWRLDSSLKFSIGKAGLNSVELVLANAAEQNFVTARGGVEAPHAILAQQRNRQGKILWADDHNGLVVPLHGDLMLGVVRSDELLARFRVRNLVSRGHNVLAVRTQHGHDSLHVIALGGGGQRAGRVVGCLERLLAMRDRNGCTEECCDHHRDKSSVHGTLDTSSLVLGATAVMVRNGQRPVSGLPGESIRRRSGT